MLSTLWTCDLLPGTRLRRSSLLMPLGGISPCPAVSTPLTRSILFPHPLSAAQLWEHPEVPSWAQKARQVDIATHCSSSGSGWGSHRELCIFSGRVPGFPHHLLPSRGVSLLAIAGAQGRCFATHSHGQSLIGLERWGTGTDGGPSSH